jgi:hypothetical protein
MTREEHVLVLAIFTKQQQLIRVLFDMLRSHNLASADDLRAFEFAAIQDEPSKDALLQEMKAFYLDVAKSLGIETGLTLP